MHLLKPAAILWFQKSKPLSSLLLGFLSLGVFTFPVLGASKNPLPQKNKLPITAASFCSGQPVLLKKVKQPITEELSLLCLDGQPTALFSTLITTAYNGTNAVNYTPLKVGPSTDQPGWVDVKVAYSLRVKKTAVQILRSEEALMGPDFPYKSADLNISFKFDPPPLLEGDADTAFTVKQRSLRDSGSRRFDDLSTHSLKLYRLIPNNFDFLLAARSLIEDTAELAKQERLFKKATVLRAAMTDPTDKTFGIVTTVMNFVVSDQQGQQDRVEDIFVNFIKADILNVFKYHSTSTAP